MRKAIPPKLRKFPAAKQRRMDELLDKNREGLITASERSRLEQLVAEAEQLAVANARLLARFAQRDTVDLPSGAVPVTVWVMPQTAEP
jgi:hypothetical protein